jgi:hypothetical protein
MIDFNHVFYLGSVCEELQAEDSVDEYNNKTDELHRAHRAHPGVSKETTQLWCKICDLNSNGCEGGGKNLCAVGWAFPARHSYARE